MPEVIRSNDEEQWLRDNFPNKPITHREDSVSVTLQNLPRHDAQELQIRADRYTREQDGHPLSDLELVQLLIEEADTWKIHFAVPKENKEKALESLASCKQVSKPETIDAYSLKVYKPPFDDFNGGHPATFIVYSSQKPSDRDLSAMADTLGEFKVSDAGKVSRFSNQVSADFANLSLSQGNGDTKNYLKKHPGYNLESDENNSTLAGQDLLNYFYRQDSNNAYLDLGNIRNEVEKIYLEATTGQGPTEMLLTIFDRLEKFLGDNYHDCDLYQSILLKVYALFVKSNPDYKDRNIYDQLSGELRSKGELSSILGRLKEDLIEYRVSIADLDGARDRVKDLIVGTMGNTRPDKLKLAMRVCDRWIKSPE